MGLLTVGAGPISESFTCFWNPTPHPELFCPPLIHGRCLVLLQLCMSCFVDSHGRTTISLNKKGRGADGGAHKGNG